MRPFRLLAFTFALCLGTPAPSVLAASQQSHTIGTFELARRPIVVNRDNLVAEVRETRRLGCRDLIRVAALVEAQFVPGSLGEFDWRMVSRLGSIVTLEGCARTARYLTAVPGIVYVKLPSRLTPSMDSARVFANIDKVHGTIPGSGLPQSLTGAGVLFAIFDSEFDTHHPAFLDKNGETRFVALWNQNDTTQKNQNRFGYGIIKNHAGLVADTAFGLDGHFHGTHMASTGAGGDWSSPYRGAAPDVKILAVQYAFGESELIDALQWSFAVADSLKMPCVVNMSIGGSEGPHDGTSLLDRAIDSLSGAGRIVVGAVGNDGNGRTHAAFTLARNETKGTFAAPQLSIQGTDTAAFSGIDLWGDVGMTFQISCRVMDTVSLAVKTGSQNVQIRGVGWYLPDTVYWSDAASGRRDTCILQIRVEGPSPLNNKPHAQVVCLSTNPRLFLGVEVTVPRTGQAGTVHGWNVQKAALRSFGQAGFVDGDGAYSVNEVGGTANRIISVGGYVNKVGIIRWDGTPTGWAINGPLYGIAAFSGQGPTVDGRVEPDITASGSLVVGAMSRRVADYGETVVWPDVSTTYGRYGQATGTSVSAPIVAGIVALMLQADPTLTPEKVRDALQKSAITDAFTGVITTPNNLWGAGKVNALGAVRSVLGLPVRGGLSAGKGLRAPSLLIDRNGVCHFSGSWTRARLEIYDCAGRTVGQRTIESAGSVALPAHLPAGIYTAAIRSAPGSVISGTVTRTIKFAR